MLPFCPLVHGKAGKVAFTHPHTLSAHTLLNVNTKTNYHHPIVVIQCDHYASGVLQTAKYLFYQESALLLRHYDTDDVAAK